MTTARPSPSTIALAVASRELYAAGRSDVVPTVRANIDAAARTLARARADQHARDIADACVHLATLEST